MQSVANPNPNPNRTRLGAQSACVACGKPSQTEFCLRPECLTYGSGALVATASPFRVKAA